MGEKQEVNQRARLKKAFVIWAIIAVCVLAAHTSLSYLSKTPSTESPHRVLSVQEPPPPKDLKDPYSLSNGGLMGRDEIQLINKQRMEENSNTYCKNGGKMKLVYKDISINPTKMIQYDQKYICEWEYGFMGTRCEECSKGFYSQHCKRCPTSMHNDIPWGVDGICDDGISGKGICFCRNRDYDPASFCETKINSDYHQNEEVIAFGFFLLLIVGFFVTILLYIYNKIHSLEVFPESIASIILGIVVGLFFKSHYKNTGLLNILEFEPHTFFLFLLPPIMFQAGFSMRASTFFRNIWTINAFAIFATIIASFIFSIVFYYGTNFSSVGFGYLDSLHFGCFISAIDPVATIAIFKSLSVNDRIYMIVFGESTLNDAVAIALAQSVERISDMTTEGEELEIQSVMIFALTKFAIYFFVSLLIGAVWSIIISYLYTIIELNTIPWIEIGFFILTSYFPYIFSEALGWSGILAILIWGMMMRNYAFYSLSPFGQVTIEYLTEWMGLMSENFIFAYLGISVPLMINDANLAYVCIGVVALVSSRLISVLVVSLWVNPFKREKIPFSHQIVMTIGGLRGAVAFYLALNVSSEYKHLIITTTISLILFTVIGLGSATPLWIKFLNGAFPKDEIIKKLSDDEIPLKAAGENNDKLGSFDDFADYQYRDRGDSFGMVSQAEDFDQKYFQRLLRKDGWKHYFEGDGKEENDNGNDIQISIQEYYRRMTQMHGDMSPNRTSQVVKNELENRLTDSKNKKDKKRTLTPPGRTEKDNIIGKFPPSNLTRKPAKKWRKRCIRPQHKLP